jgi:hypothetical protein
MSLFVENIVVQAIGPTTTTPECTSESASSVKARRCSKNHVKKVKKVTRTKSINNTRPTNDLVQFRIGHTASKVVPTRRERARAFKLSAFPDLDRCNSLLYFPATLTRLVNSGDFKELEKMLNSRTVNKSYFQFHGCDHLKTTAEFVSKMMLRDSIHPDSMTCIRGTKVIENQIVATAYYKFTDNKFLHNVAVQSNPSVCTHYTPFVVNAGTRSERLLPAVKPSFADEEQRVRAINVLDSDEDLVIYGKGTITLTLDELSKKIVRISFDGCVTSVAVASSPNVNIISRSA